MFHRYMTRLINRHGCTWWVNLTEPPRTGKLADVVQGRRFEMLTLLVISLNCLYTLYEANYHIAYLTDGRTNLMVLVDTFFTVFYAIELLLKIKVHRLFFFCNDEMAWNIFDTVLVLVAIAEALSSASIRTPTSLRLIRTARLSKFFRMVRVLRFFTELRLMMNCVLGSFMSLFWCCLLLLGISILFSMIIVQQVTEHLIDKGDNLNERLRSALLDAYGSVEITTFTLFCSISGGDWPEYFNILVTTSMLCRIVYISYIVLVWLSVTNIITSIFIEKAMKLARPELEEQLLLKQKEDLDHALQLKALFQEMDLDCSGTITWAEFQKCMQDVRFASYFQIKDLEIHDVSLFFKMLATIGDTDEVDLETFVACCLRMKGAAMNIDLLQLGYETRIFAKRQQEASQALNERHERLAAHVAQIARRLGFGQVLSV